MMKGLFADDGGDEEREQRDTERSRRFPITYSDARSTHPVSREGAERMGGVAHRVAMHIPSYQILAARRRVVGSCRADVPAIATGTCVHVWIKAGRDR